MMKRHVLTTLALAGSLTAAASAQNPPAQGQQPPVFRSSTRLVVNTVVVRDKDGKVIEGDATEVQTIRDAWTFARDTGSRDPNWKLVATEAV